MKETIFFLEGRGGAYPYHFFMYNLSGLYYISKKIYDHKRSGSLLFNDNPRRIVSSPTTQITFPIKIHMKDILPFQREAFDIIKDKFELIEDLSKHNDYEIVSIYGAPAEISDNNDGIEVFPFIRSIFTQNMNFNMKTGKRIFITRRNSESQHQGVLKRCIMNEGLLMNMLQKYNFEYIQLENFTTFEKIKLFMESEVIVSSNSGALSFLLFADKNAKIVEIIKNGEGLGNNHYLTICKHLNLNYNRYSNINEDRLGNFNLNVEEFEKYLISLI